MTNEQVMKIMEDLGLHEGGMVNWVYDNAWVKFANIVEAAERKECVKICNEQALLGNVGATYCASDIRMRGGGGRA